MPTPATRLLLPGPLVIIGFAYRTAWALATVLVVRTRGLDGFAVLGLAVYIAMAAAALFTRQAANAGVSDRHVLQTAAAATAALRAGSFGLLAAGAPLWAVVTAEAGARLASPVIDAGVRTRLAAASSTPTAALAGAEGGKRAGLWIGTIAAGLIGAWLPLGLVAAAGAIAAVLPAAAAMAVLRTTSQPTTDVDPSAAAGTDDQAGTPARPTDAQEGSHLADDVPWTLLSWAAAIHLLAAGLPATTIALVEQLHGSVWLGVVLAGDITAVAVAPMMARHPNLTAHGPSAWLLASGGSTLVWTVVGTSVPGLLVATAASAVALTWVAAQVQAAAITSHSAHTTARLVWIRTGKSVGTGIAVAVVAQALDGGVTVAAVAATSTVVCALAAAVLHTVRTPATT